MTLYEVQTFYGTHRRTFEKEYHAIEYAIKIAALLDIDFDLMEITPYQANRNEYIYTYLSD